MALNKDVARLAKGKNRATVVTLMPGGQPQALPTWIDHDGEHLLVNTEPQRQRAKNVGKDSRVTILIQAPNDGWDWAEIRGHVVGTIGGRQAREHIDELSQRYNGYDYDRAIGPGGRIILVIAADRVNTPRTLGLLRRELHATAGAVSG